MPKITVSVNGVQKLLSNLKQDMAAGPDKIKLLVLKELSSENFSNKNTPFSEIPGHRNSPESMDICKCNTAVQERQQRRPSELQTYLSHLFYVNP
ncbi:hypothetical protein DPMN_194619 [Dreissena polymorpha]|uniref:Uncharacterized protein n=1 Tax=Dreissena polymorpha TaxID=45954 RepID=A0A9D3XZZ3_DREPO|nr:hypothetical protein DPMN_194619 [Dreissena polymorpha]